MCDQDQIILAFSRLQDLLAFAEEPPSLSSQQEAVVQSAFVLCLESDTVAINDAAFYALNHLVYCDGVTQPNRVFSQLFRLWFRLSSPRSIDDLQCIQALGNACVSMLASFLSTKVPATSDNADAAHPLSRSLHDALMTSSNPAGVVTLLDRFAPASPHLPFFVMSAAVSAINFHPTTACDLLSLVLRVQRLLNY